MYNPTDAFGKMMVHNFKERGCPLIGMSFFTSEAEIKKRYHDLGFSLDLFSMKSIYYNHLDQEERKRIEKLEFLDELEEFWLIQNHYFMSLAKKIKTGNPPAKNANEIIEKLNIEGA